MSHDTPDGTRKRRLWCNHCQLSEVPWADLKVTVSTDRDHASVVALVECTLVELTHGAVGAVFLS